MKLVVEISLYPLREKYIAPIQSFIDRLNCYGHIEVITTATCTVISGNYAEVMSILTKEMQFTHEQVGQAIFVCKFLNGDAMGTGY